MTVVAWDGKTLAADKAATAVGHSSTVTKVFRVPGGIVAFSGESTRCMELLHWFNGGRVVADFVKEVENSGTCGMFIDDFGKDFHYYNSPYPVAGEDKFCAMGHGRDYALAAMYLGFDAKTAVEVACALDNTCGKGVDTMVPENKWAKQ